MTLAGLISQLESMARVTGLVHSEAEVVANFGGAPVVALLYREGTDMVTVRLIDKDMAESYETLIEDNKLMGNYETNTLVYLDDI
jgi:hypothetical protein